VLRSPLFKSSWTINNWISSRICIPTNGSGTGLKLQQCRMQRTLLADNQNVIPNICETVGLLLRSEESTSKSILLHLSRHPACDARDRSIVAVKPADWHSAALRVTSTATPTDQCISAHYHHNISTNIIYSRSGMSTKTNTKYCENL